MTVSEIRQQIKACHPDLRGGNTSRVGRLRKLVAALRKRCRFCGGPMPFARSPTGVARMTTCGWMCSLALRRKPIGLIAAWLLLAAALPAQTNNPFQQGLSWMPSPTTNISIYALYFTTNNPPTDGFSRVAITNQFWGTNLLASITNGYWKTNFVSDVTNWLTLTAVADNGSESEPTPVIPHVPPKPPTMFRLFMQTSPTTDGPWQTLTNVPPVEVLTDQPKLFTRILQEPVASP